MAPPSRLLVTGLPGTGKTTLCKRASERLAPLAAARGGNGFQLEGFLCHECRNHSNQRSAFKVVSLDGAQKATLASVDGPDTGRHVGRYRVQVEEFEGVALPILERVAKSSGPRLLIFDEIGKMELKSVGFVRIMRQLLASPDAELHILGTVALQGGGLIRESKEMLGVKVLQIDEGNRDSARAEVERRFFGALGLEPGGAKPVGMSPTAMLSAPPASLLRARPLPTQGFTFAEAPGPGQFTPVYPEDPTQNLASLNAGDYRLYVGGAAINRAFAEELQKAGHREPKSRFELLHEALLDAASRAQGALCWLQPASLFPEDGAATRVTRCYYCKRQTECRDAPWEGWRGQFFCSDCRDFYTSWAFEGLLGICGLVPAPGDDGVPERQLAALRPVGLTTVTVFRPRKRPRGSERNVAMVYTVGPNCGDKVQKRARRDADKLSPEAFLQVCESVGGAVALAVTRYNQERSSVADTTDALPRIDVLRVCLVSGGVYRHPETGKEDVAKALLRGLVRAHDGGTDSPLYDFAWDDDVFRLAWEKMQDSGAGT